MMLAASIEFKRNFCGRDHANLQVGGQRRDFVAAHRSGSCRGL